jgi:hypothetical protein
MNSVYPLLVCLLAIIYPVQLANPPCGGKYNTNPILRDEPTFVSSVPNGKRYVVGSGYDKINIVHVYGAPYDMGYALGKLMSTELQALLPEYFAYLDKTIEDAIKVVPLVSMKKNSFYFVLTYSCFLFFSLYQNGLLN